MVWINLFIPLIVTTILILFFKEKTVWWELVLVWISTVLFILIAKAIAINSLTSDIEYLGGVVKRVEYYEDWNEYIHKTCSYQICTGSGKTRSCTTHYYDCSYVKYHPEYWCIQTTFGEYGISKNRYNRLKKQFGTPETFKDLNRHYHSIDGDMYYVNWGGEEKTVEPVAKTESYENKPQASLNVFHYDVLDTSDIKTYKLYDYPEIENNKQPVILGYNNYQASQSLQYFNGVYGPSKQIRVFILIFENLPREAGIAQETYWAGGNKNEFVVCVGKYGNEIRWAHIFSWTDIKELDVEVMHSIEGLGQFNINKIVSITTESCKKLWVRKNFSDFDYLHIEPSPNQMIWIMILTMMVNIGVGAYVIFNDFDSEEEKLKNKRKFKKFF